MGKAEKCETLENLGEKILENGSESSLGDLLVWKAHILDLVGKELEGFLLQVIRSDLFIP